MKRRRRLRNALDSVLSPQLMNIMHRSSTWHPDARDRRRQVGLFAAIISLTFITLIMFVWSMQSGPLPITLEGALIGTTALLALRGRRLTTQLRYNLRLVFWLFFVAITISVVVWIGEVGPLLPIVFELLLLLVALLVMRLTRHHDDPTLES